jgi:hypothetical protein
MYFRSQSRNFLQEVGSNAGRRLCSRTISNNLRLLQPSHVLNHKLTVFQEAFSRLQNSASCDLSWFAQAPLHMRFKSTLLCSQNQTSPSIFLRFCSRANPGQSAEASSQLKDLQCGQSSTMSTHRSTAQFTSSILNCKAVLSPALGFLQAPLHRLYLQRVLEAGCALDGLPTLVYDETNTSQVRLSFRLSRCFVVGLTQEYAIVEVALFGEYHGIFGPFWLP